MCIRDSIRAEQDSNDMYVSIDLVEEIIERQIKTYKTKLIDKKQSALSFSEAFLQEEPEHEETIKIVKTKRFAMKPMDPEEACIQMELLGHNFFMFLNADTVSYTHLAESLKRFPGQTFRAGHQHQAVSPAFRMIRRMRDVYKRQSRRAVISSSIPQEQTASLHTVSLLADRSSAGSWKAMQSFKNLRK